MLTELTTIFESIDREIFTEDVLQKISTLVEEKVQTKVNERVTLEVENALKEQDEDYTTKLQQVQEMIDKDHTAKIKQVVEFINEDYSTKLVTISNKYKKLLKETAIEHKDSLVESINDFLDLYIEKAVPRAQIAEAAKNTYTQKVLEEARKVMGIDDKYIRGNFKEALKDGKSQMDKLIKENTDLRNKVVVTESKRLLAEKTANLPTEVAKFVRSRLQDKEPQFIKENFQYVLDMFQRKEKNDKRSALLNENKSNVDRNKVADELTEQNESKPINEDNAAPSMVDIYLEGMNFRK